MSEQRARAEEQIRRTIESDMPIEKKVQIIANGIQSGVDKGYEMTMAHLAREDEALAALAAAEQRVGELKQALGDIVTFTTPGYAKDATDAANQAHHLARRALNRLEE